MYTTWPFGLSDIISYYSSPHHMAPVTWALFLFLDKPNTLPGQSLCTCYLFCLECSSPREMGDNLPASSGLFCMKEEDFHDYSMENRNPIPFP